MGAAADATVGPETAVAVPTGGMLPTGADAVVMIEHTQEAMPGTIEVTRPVAPGEGIVRGDEDLAPRATIVARATPTRPGPGDARRARGHRLAVHARPASRDPRHGRRGRPARYRAVAPGMSATP